MSTVRRVGAVELGIFLTLLISQKRTTLHDGRHAAGARLRRIRRPRKNCALAGADGGDGDWRAKSIVVILLKQAIARKVLAEEVVGDGLEAAEQLTLCVVPIDERTSCEIHRRADEAIRKVGGATALD